MLGPIRGQLAEDCRGKWWQIKSVGWRSILFYRPIPHWRFYSREENQRYFFELYIDMYILYYILYLFPCFCHPYRFSAKSRTLVVSHAVLSHRSLTFWRSKHLLVRNDEKHSLRIESFRRTPPLGRSGYRHTAHGTECWKSHLSPSKGYRYTRQRNRVLKKLSFSF